MNVATVARPLADGANSCSMFMWQQDQLLQLVNGRVITFDDSTLLKTLMTF